MNFDLILDSQNLKNPVTYIVNNKNEIMKIFKYVGQYISLRNIVDLVSYLLNTISNWSFYLDDFTCTYHVEGGKQKIIM